MAKNNRSLIMAAAALGVFALILTVYALTRPPAVEAPAPPAPGTAAAPVATRTMQFVASRDIPPRTLITRAMLREVETDKAQPGAITDPQQVVGQISKMPIRAEQTITRDLITETLQRVIPANFVIPDGLRAVAVYVDPTSTAAGLVDVGDRVDVIATHDLTLEKQSTEGYEQVLQGSKDITVGRTIAQDLQVLAVDRSLNSQPTPTPTPAPAAGGDSAGAPAAPPPPPGATATPGGQPAGKTRVFLAATPEVAERLVAANSKGTLNLTIRNPNSREQFPVAPAIEYPSRLINVPKRKPQNNGGGTPVRVRSSEPMPSFNPQPMMPQVAPAMPTTPIDTTPAGSEVTVIRGTEKTRVLVPSR